MMEFREFVWGLKLLTLLFLFSCNEVVKRKASEEKIDTLTIRIGDVHALPNPRSDSRVYLKSLNGEQITHFHADSTYEVLIEHGFGAEIHLFAKSDNYHLEQFDSTYRLTIPPLDSGKIERILFGFRTDFSKNILYYHHKYRDIDDSTKIVESLTQIDTVAFMDLELHGKHKGIFHKSMK